MKRIVPLAVLAILLTSCSLNTSDFRKVDTTTTTTAAATAAPTQSGVEVPSVVGLAGDAARDAIEAARFKVKWDAGEDSVWKASNWTVDAQTPAAGSGAEEGSTVVLTVSKPAAPAPAPAAATSAGLTATYAQAACNAYGDANFVYGWKPHWIVGKLAEEIQNDQWFLKVEADVKNAYNAEAAMNVECFVSGTNEAPVVTAFNAY